VDLATEAFIIIGILHAAQSQDQILSEKSRLIPIKTLKITPLTTDKKLGWDPAVGSECHCPRQ